MKVDVVVADLTTQRDAAALVNSCNGLLEPKAGLSAAIHRAAGPELADACQSLAPVPVGSAVVTWGYLLGGQIIHAIAPHWRGGAETAEADLERTIESILQIAGDSRISTLAVPAIGVGGHGYPPVVAARVMARVLLRHARRSTPIQWVRICVSTPLLQQIWLEALGAQEGMGWGPDGHPLLPAAFTLWPRDRISLDCRLSFPMHALPLIERGWEPYDMDDKWEHRYRAPWLEVWRPRVGGTLAFILRLEQRGERLVVQESWGDSTFLTALCNDNLGELRGLATWVAEALPQLADNNYQDEASHLAFSTHDMQGRIAKGEASFSGTTRSPEELRTIAQVLLTQADSLEAQRTITDYAISAQSRFRGCLLGLACGDAVGTSVEFRARGSFEPLTDMVGGGPFGLEPGEWTDDTSMALCLAASLVETGRCDPNDHMLRYLRWMDTGYMSSNGRCFDVGNTTRKALEKFRATGHALDGPVAADQAGNGALMRLAPVVLFAYPFRSKALDLAEVATKTTHGAAECIEASRLFAAILMQALAGANKEGVLFGHDVHRLRSPRLIAIARGGYVGKPIGEIRGSGYVVASLEAALWCFWTTDSFEQAILAAANLGEDADTTAAICGQLAGAYYGFDDIPAHWRSRLVMHDDILNFADRLHGSER